MKRIFLIHILSFISYFQISAQGNLIVNPGFEDSSRKIIPIIHYNIGHNGTQLVDGWFIASDGTSDYFNSDSSRNYYRGHKHSRLLPKAHSGQGRGGLIAYSGAGVWKNLWTEYLESQLSSPLKAGKKYCVSFYVLLDSGCRYSASNLGAYFSNEKLIAYRKFAFRNMPQVICGDTALLTKRGVWSKISGEYIAKGGENFITLGCFEYHGMCPTEKHLSKLIDAEIGHEAYYYLDDVSVEEVPNSNCDIQNAEALTLQNFVLLVDGSGSMHDEHYIDLLKEKVSDFVLSLNPNEKISLIVFGTDSKILLKGSYARNFDSLQMALVNIPKSGGTNINSGLGDAYKVMDQTLVTGANNRIILFTDGRFKLEKSAKELIEQHYTEKNIGISTIQFGAFKNGGLKHLARRTNANYNKTNNGNFKKVLKSQESYSTCSRKVDRRRHHAWWRIFTLDLLVYGGFETFIVLMVVSHSKKPG